MLYDKFDVVVHKIIYCDNELKKKLRNDLNT